jgi:putative spermidine/putrescine transport system ATP-binding protein
MALLELKDVCAGYGENMILKHYDIAIEEGKLVSLLGPSGCGKTTTLRLIAGFSEPKSGQVLFNGRDITRTPPNKRNFGFVFQSYALFPHMTIFDNVAYGLKMRGVGKDEMAERVEKMLATVDLEGLGGRYPRELSGGQRQRVALARALVIRPDLLLMDEPLSNLDAKLRVKMRVEIRRIQQELGITTIYVTHDQEECFAISDEVAIMNNGAIEQMGTPQEIYSHPQTEFVMNFVGFDNRIELAREQDGWKAADGTLFRAQEQLEAPRALGYLRSDDVEVLPAGTAAENAVSGRIDVKTYLGRRYQYNISTAVGTLVARVEDGSFAVGDAATVVLPKERMALIRPEAPEAQPAGSR